MKALTELFREWMPHQRWFGGKGREWADVSEDGFFLDRSNPVLSVHRVRVTYADGSEEIQKAGDLCYLPPGHTSVIEEDIEFVEFSRPAEHQPVLDHVARVAAAT